MRSTVLRESSPLQYSTVRAALQLLASVANLRPFLCGVACPRRVAPSLGSPGPTNQSHLAKEPLTGEIASAQSLPNTTRSNTDLDIGLHHNFQLILGVLRAMQRLFFAVLQRTHHRFDLRLPALRHSAAEHRMSESVQRAALQLRTSRVESLAICVCTLRLRRVRHISAVTSSELPLSIICVARRASTSS
jgi:hypothetical protein